MKNISNRAEILTIISLLCLISPLFAQELPVIHYGINEGLDSVVINHLTQDSYGRIWIAHHAGISAYDGHRFQNWNQKHGLLNNSPISILAGDDGLIWILFADNGIQYLTSEGNIRSVPDPRGCFEEDRITLLFKLTNGQILAAGDNGYYHVSRNSIDGPHYPIQNETGAVNSILEWDEEDMLLACIDGVYIHRGNSYDKLPLPYESIGTKIMADLTRDDQGNLWILTTNSRLVRYNRDECSTWNLPIEEKENLHAFACRCSPDGSVWVVSGNGLFQWKNGEVNHFTEEQGLISSWINCLLVDREGILWLGAEGGLDKIAHTAFRNFRYHRDFPVNAVWSIEEMEDGSIWMGTNKGILSLPPDGSLHRVYTIKDGLMDNSIIDLEAAPDGTAWILTYTGVCFWDGKSFHQYPSDDLSQIGLYDLLPLNRQNEVWISTSEGLYSLNSETEEIQLLPLNGKINRPGTLNFLNQTSDGTIYILGPSVYTYSFNSGLKKIDLPEWVRGISLFKMIEGENTLWFLSDSGLISYDGTIWKPYFVNDAVFFDAVHIKDNDIWVGLNSGIGHFDGNEYIFFSQHDGISVGECNLGASLLDSKGRIWLGGQNMTVIRSSEIREFPPSKPLITRTIVDRKNHAMPQFLTFSSRSKRIIFHFSTPSFFNEQDQLYRYRLMGLESKWSEPTRDHSIRYAGIPPGRYQFEVQSRQKHGRWNGSIQSLGIEVIPTFTQTPLAKILVVLALLVFGFALGAIRIARIKSHEAKLEKLVHEQTKQIRSQRDQLSELARTDDLTGIPNRRFFYEAFEGEIKRAQRHNHPLCLCIFDLDQFKEFNDRYGHTTGDSILKEIGNRSKKCVRRSDTFARWGGDEFILLVKEVDWKNVLNICRRIKSGLQQAPVCWQDGVPLTFTLSAGVVCWNPAENPKATHEDLFKYADAALYQAKAEGRDRIHVYPW